jgi:hypothetical protein
MQNVQVVQAAQNVQPPVPEEQMTEEEAKSKLAALAARVADRKRVEEAQNEMDQKKQNITDIIYNKQTLPKIVNENSKFVVATYWWGNDNLNKNYARPCQKYYEDFFMLPYEVFKRSETIRKYYQRKKLKNTIPSLITVHAANANPTPAALDQSLNLIQGVVGQSDLADFVQGSDGQQPQEEQYFSASDAAVPYPTAAVPPMAAATPVTQQGGEKLNVNPLFKIILYGNMFPHLFAKYIKEYYDTAKMYNIAVDDRFADKEAFEKRMFLLMDKYIAGNVKTFDDLLPVFQDEYEPVMKDIEATKNEQKVREKSNLPESPELKKKLIGLNIRNNDIMRKIQAIVGDYKKAIKTQGAFVKEIFPEFFTEADAAMVDSIQCLNKVLEFRSPVLFQNMIKGWEEACERSNCNYIAVEYPQFAVPADPKIPGSGGYQMAINAKPIFIRRMLDLCEGRGVLYIDGDMTINKYPKIFDMEDVDYMARGWHIDPRSNEKFLDGDFEFDPYNFDTSGGTMFFGNTPEARSFLDQWIYYSFRSINKGKADDRIISLVMNTMSLLGPLKVLQLPVEYLWLTMWYNYYLKDDVVDMKDVVIEHPECLTSEDTAAGSGAASDRTPKRYAELESVSSLNRSEEFYEDVLFDEPRFADCLRSWMNFIGGLEYPENHPDLPEESPAYFFPWGSYGSKTLEYQTNCIRYDYPRIANEIPQMPPVSFEKLVVENTTAVIPHIVHQIWFSADNTIPPHKLALFERVRKAAKCAGWTYKLWTRDDYTAKNFPCVWESCKKAEAAMAAGTQSRWAQIADLCRYEIMCRFGGAYLDSNFLISHRLLKRIEQLNAKNGKQVIVCNEDNGGLGHKYMSNSFIASVRHHHVFKNLIDDEMLENINFNSKYVNKTTGPYYLRSGFDILDEDYSEIAVLEPEEVYPVPMSGSERAGAKPVENPIIKVGAYDPNEDEDTVVVPGEPQKTIILNTWEQIFPDSLAIYLVGIGGSWTYDEDEEETAGSSTVPNATTAAVEQQPPAVEPVPELGVSAANAAA